MAEKKTAYIKKHPCLIIWGIILLFLIGIIFGPGLYHRLFPETFIREIIPVDEHHFILVMEDEFRQKFLRCRNFKEHRTVWETYLPFRYSFNTLDNKIAPYFKVYSDKFIYRIMEYHPNGDMDDTIDKVVCLDLETGKILWIHEIDSEGNRCSLLYTSTVFDDEMTFLLACYAEAAVESVLSLRALHNTNGEILWKTIFKADMPQTPLLTTDFLIFHDGNDLFFIEKSTG